MRKESSLVVIYNQTYFPDGPEGEGMYFHMIEAIDESGPVVNDALVETLDEFGLNVPLMRDFESLKAFVLVLSKRLKIFGAHLMSLEDYNKALESINHIEEYRQFLMTCGDLVVNENYGKSSSLFKKIFQ